MPKQVNYPHEQMENVGSSLRGHAETLRSTASEGGGGLPSGSLGNLGESAASTISGHLTNVPGQIRQMADREEAHGNRVTQNSQDMRETDQEHRQKLENIHTGMTEPTVSGGSGGSRGGGPPMAPGGQGEPEDDGEGEGRISPSGAPDPNAAPGGRRTRIGAKQDASVKRSLQRENDSADILARAGYQVEQNPAVPGAKNPDYKIEGQVFDNYAPSKSNVRGIASEIQGKVDKGQADRIVLNLADSDADLGKLQGQLSDWPIAGLKEVIVIDKQGGVVPFYPFSESDRT